MVTVSYIFCALLRACESSSNSLLMQLPTEYFCRVLGKWNKYSSCLYKTETDSLQDAEENMLGTLQHQWFYFGRDIELDTPQSIHFHYLKQTCMYQSVLFDFEGRSTGQHASCGIIWNRFRTLQSTHVSFVRCWVLIFVVNGMTGQLDLIHSTCLNVWIKAIML